MLWCCIRVPGWLSFVIQMLHFFSTMFAVIPNISVIEKGEEQSPFLSPVEKDFKWFCYLYYGSGA